MFCLAEKQILLSDQAQKMREWLSGSRYTAVCFLTLASFGMTPTTHTLSSWRTKCNVDFLNLEAGCDLIANLKTLLKFRDDFKLSIHCHSVYLYNGDGDSKNNQDGISVSVN